MIKKDYKGKCEKRKLSKIKGICKTYSDIQRVYADLIQNDNNIVEAETNVLLDDNTIGSYTSDFCVEKQTEIY